MKNEKAIIRVHNFPAIQDLVCVSSTFFLRQVVQYVELEKEQRTAIRTFKVLGAFLLCEQLTG